ncbi:hypothetical protein GA0061098_100373 [Bradyrhizobium shewense]|uniref:Uncharacterized protein n=1 Tax=Bradyrhizobium shewense TaxID=1761772 RepID=A0A1C3V0A7_9BRAD|nr:hypothetical protein GA0061098_100373 [Bradyrhizobium shewense]
MASPSCKLALLYVEPQCSDLIKFCAYRCKCDSEVLQTLSELAPDISRANDLSTGVPGDLAGHVHGVTEGRRDNHHLPESIV